MGIITTVDEDCNAVKGCEMASLSTESHGESQECSSSNRPRMVSFHELLTTSIHPIPLRSPDEIAELFYNRQDFAAFQVNEQRRYDKMMMKRIQQMVQEAMKDKLEAAYARNASPEEIDAMMPQTTEEIFLVLGGISALDILRPPSVVRAEPTYLSTQTIETAEESSSDIDREEGHQQKETEEEVEAEKEEERFSPKKAPDNQLEYISDDALYDIMCVEKDENIEPTRHFTDDGVITLSPHGKEKKNTEEASGNPNGNPKRQKRKHLPRPNQWAEATDAELYDLLELPKEDASPGNESTRGGNDNKQRSRFHRPEKWTDATDEELYDMFELERDEASRMKETKRDEIAVEGTFKEHLNDVRLGNDEASEVAVPKGIEAINYVLEKSFSIESTGRGSSGIAPQKHSQPITSTRH